MPRSHFNLSVLEKVRESIAGPIRKHQLEGHDQLNKTVDARINQMTQLELLEAISNALEEP